MVRSTFNILFYLKYGTPSRDGRLPLMCRITIDGESTTFSCRRRLPADLWDAQQARLSGDTYEAELINGEISRLREQLVSDYAAILKEYGSVKPRWLKEVTLGTPEKQEMLLYFFKRHNEDYRKMVGYGRSERSCQRYEVVARHLKDFIRQIYSLPDIRFRYITINFINKFEVWLRSEKRFRNNTVWVYMITFKHILTLARSSGMMRSDPFSGYKNRFEQVDRGYLTEGELGALIRLPLEPGTGRTVRDLFVFSAFTGLSYSDVKALRWVNVKQMFDGKTWIVTRRRKTNTPSNIRLFDVPLRILERYGRPGEDTVFKIPSNSCCNGYLMDFAARCGIQTRLTFHIARHTFATLSLSKGMPIETLSSILGHTSIRTTQIYAKITNQKISEDMESLAEKIKAFEMPE
ncbi:MAG: site-specific integrase [Bacteroidales bacterium]|nr:site-specific integrase [Bacteroidales bacterium]